MTIVNTENPSKLDTIHIRRMLHAFYLLCLELRGVFDEDVQDILDAYSITLLPGQRAGIEYPEGVPQILGRELTEEKNALERSRKLEEEIREEGLRSKKRLTRNK